MDDKPTQSRGRPRKSAPARVRGGGSIRSEAPDRHVLRYDASREGEPRRQRTQLFKGTRKEAEDKLRELVHKVKSGEAANDEGLTVSAHFDEWLEWLESQKRAHYTVAGYRALVEHFVSPQLGKIRLEKLTARDIDRAIAAWRKQPRRDKRKGQLSEQTIKHAFACLKAGLALAEKWERIGRNPIRGATSPKPVKAKISSLDQNQAVELLRGLQSGSLRDLYVPVVVLLYCGLRRGELLGLKWSDIDLEKATLRVERSLEMIDGRPHFKTPKTATSARSMSLPPFCVDALRAHRKEQNEHALKSGRRADFNSGDLVFPAPNGEAWEPGKFGSRFYWGIRSHKLPIVSVHGLRHTSASLMIASGVDMKVLSVRLGHATMGITSDTYVHVKVAQEIDAAQKLGATLDEAFSRSGTSRASGE